VTGGGAVREDEALADIVIDATGVYGTAGALGDGGIPARGEREARAWIDYRLPDVLGADRTRFAGRTTLVVGAGHSAATTLAGLARLVEQAPGTRVVWARRDTTAAPATVLPDDPLPARAHLARFLNALASAPPQGIAARAGVVVSRLDVRDECVRVSLREVASGAESAVDVDRIVAMVGYRPNPAIHRELQVHHCYASEGPMALAAALLGASTDSDCLARSGFGPRSLETTEPGFFIVGHKSYGRRSDFLLRIGREQIRDVFRLLEDVPSLDLDALYA